MWENGDPLREVGKIKLKKVSLSHTKDFLLSLSNDNLVKYFKNSHHKSILPYYTDPGDRVVDKGETGGRAFN